MQKATTKKISILIAIMMSTLGTIWWDNQIQNNMHAKSEAQVAIDTGSIEEETQESSSNEDVNQLPQLTISESNFQETKRSENGNNKTSVKGKIQTEKEYDIEIIYERNGKEWKIKKTQLSGNQELQKDINKLFDSNDKVSMNNIIKKTQNFERNQKICNDIKSVVTGTTIDVCTTDKIQINSRKHVYTFNLIDLTVTKVESSKTGHERDQYNNTTLNPNAIIPFIEKILLIESPNEEDNSISSIVGKKLETEIIIGTKRENSALINFSINNISMTANYIVDTNTIKGLFINDIIINEKPLLIRTFELKLEHTADIETFKTQPLAFISNFYPKIEKLYIEETK